MRTKHLNFGAITLLAAASALVWVLMSMPAQAQDMNIDGPPSEEPTSGSSMVMLGLGVLNTPSYLGSDERKTRALPLIDARWRNGWFAGTRGIGYRLDTGTPFSGGVRLTVDLGRDEDDADALRGMGDIKARPELGLFANYKLTPGLGLGTSFRYGSGNDRDGILADISLNGSFRINPSNRLVGGLTTTFANTKAMQSAFGVDATQSLSSGYALYSPGSGLRDVSLQIGNMTMLRPNTMLFIGVDARTLMGDAKDSPLTTKRTGVGALATLSFRL
jgi:MipA family protein